MKRSYKYRYAIYGLLVAAVYCILLFGLHYLISSGTPGELLRESPAAAILALLSLPVCLLTGYLIGLERDKRRSAGPLTEQYREKSELVTKISGSFEQSEEMRRMAGIAAQEMKHPLTSIVGYALTLRGYWDKLDDRSKLEFADYIKVSSSRLEGIVNDLLRIMKLESYYPRRRDETFDLADILNEVCKILEEIYAAGGLKVALRFLEEIPPLHGDPSLFFDLIYNLLDICMRCSEGNGMVSAWCSLKDTRITLHLRCHHATIKPVEIERIKVWPPRERDDEMATLGMEYRLASSMVDEAGGTLRMEAVGESGISFILSFPR